MEWYYYDFILGFLLIFFGIVLLKLVKAKTWFRVTCIVIGTAVVLSAIIQLFKLIE